MPIIIANVVTVRFFTCSNLRKIIFLPQIFKYREFMSFLYNTQEIISELEKDNPNRLKTY